MTPVLAEVVFATWQAVFLIVLCFGSLAASLYCIFFMVPLRSFMKHVNSLGGGMEGIRSHVEGVREEIDTRLNNLEQDLEEALTQHREEVSDSVSATERVASQNREQLEALDETVKNLQDTLSSTQENLEKFDDRLNALRNRHASLNRTVEGMEEKVEGAVQKTVRDAYGSLEGSILGALEALQDEMLRPGGKNQKGGDDSTHHRSRSGDSTDEYADKIISAEPLFSEVDEQSDVTDEEEDQGNDDESPDK